MWKYTGVLVMPAMFIAGCSTKQESAFPLEQDEFQIERTAVPQPALTALERLSGGAELIAFEMEDRGAYTVFEGEWIQNGVEQEATVMADGTLLESERELMPEDYDSLPPGALAQVRELESQGYRVEIARREIILYDLDAVRGEEISEDEIEMVIRPDGTVISNDR